MTMWNDRHMPYPLLAPWTDDYGDAAFVGHVPHAMLNNGKEISLTIKYHLTSQSLRELISNGSARYISVIACPSTFSRMSTSLIGQEDDLHVLVSSNYSKELIFTPYVVSTDRIEGFTSNEHAEEIRYIKPQGFNIPPSSRLAIGASTSITLEAGGSPYSVIDLVNDSNADGGSFKVDLNDNRIKIYVAPEDKDRIEALRQQVASSMENAALFPSIYLHAVVEALRNLSEYSDRQWTRTMRDALDRHDIGVDDEELKDNALVYAQTLMEKPVGRLLTAFTNRDVEE